MSGKLTTRDDAAHHTSSNPKRRDFIDRGGQPRWIQLMGQLDDETVYWLGGKGYRMRVFTSKHPREADFTEDELQSLERLPSD